MEVVNHPGVPNQELRAVRFLNALDKKKYRSFLAHVENEAISGAAIYPLTLDAAFGRAVNFRLPPSDHSRVNKSESSLPPRSR